MHLVFVYGTLKRGRGNNRLLGNSRLVARVHTQDPYPLIAPGLPFLLPFKGEGRQVRGEVYRVDDETLELLDQLEQHPHWYKREQIPVVSPSGARYIAWAYLLSEQWVRPDWRRYPFLSSF